MCALHAQMELSIAFPVEKGFIQIMGSVLRDVLVEHSRIIREHALNSHQNVLHASIFTITLA